MKYINIGKITSTHGIKGELKIISSFSYKEKIFKKNMIIYIGLDKNKEIISSYRPHKQYDMVTLKGYDNINQVLKYLKNNVYINKDDLILEDNELLEEDLIGLDAIINNEIIGKVIGIEKHAHHNIIVIKNNKKEYLIPYVFDIIEEINLKTGKIIIKNLKGLIE